MIEPEIDGVGVVVLGDFNPAIFTPAWFALHGLLSESAAESANLEIAGPTLTRFSTDWLSFHATVDRFDADTAQAPHSRVRDLVVRVFKEQLNMSPRAIGINRHVHFRVGSLSERDRIGRTLAPVEPWGWFGEELGPDGEHGGMTSLRMSQVTPKGRPPGGEINVVVEPSNRIGDGRLGVFVSVNDHYEIDQSNARGISYLIDYLERDFDRSLRRSDSIIDQIMSLAKEG